MNATCADGVRSRLFIVLQYLLPQHWLSRLAYRITRSRVPLIKNALIRGFVNRFQPDMSEAEQPDPLEYESFNAFFTRALRAPARPCDPDPAVLISPVDGSVSQIGRLEGSWLVQAKGHAYTLESLLAADLSWPAQLRGGAFATLYLAPSNYHRVHMPLSGVLRAAWYVPGALFSVDATTTAGVPGLLARNGRGAGLVLPHAEVGGGRGRSGGLHAGGGECAGGGGENPLRRGAAGAGRRGAPGPRRAAVPARLARVRHEASARRRQRRHLPDL